MLERLEIEHFVRKLSPKIIGKVKSRKPHTLAYALEKARIYEAEDPPSKKRAKLPIEKQTQLLAASSTPAVDQVDQSAIKTIETATTVPTSKHITMESLSK